MFLIELVKIDIRYVWLEDLHVVFLLNYGLEIYHICFLCLLFLNLLHLEQRLLLLLEVAMRSGSCGRGCMLNHDIVAPGLLRWHHLFLFIIVDINPQVLSHFSKIYIILINRYNYKTWNFKRTFNSFCNIRIHLLRDFSVRSPSSLPHYYCYFQSSSKKNYYYLVYWPKVNCHHYYGCRYYLRDL